MADLLGANAAVVVFVLRFQPLVSDAFQPAAFCPGEGVAVAVIVTKGVACVVVGNGMPIHSGEKILPVRIAIGIAVADGAVVEGQDIACIVVGIGFGTAVLVGRLQELALVVVRIVDPVPGPGLELTGDIAHRVVGVAELLQRGVPDPGPLLADPGGGSAGGGAVGIEEPLPDLAAHVLIRQALQRVVFVGQSAPVHHPHGH